MSHEYMKGSQWRKWDLHVHTPCAVMNNQYKGWDRYIAKLNEVTRQKDIKALGITDYFSIDGYKEILKYKNELENVELILPNIEFRLDNIIYRRKKRNKPRRLNFHVIFSDEVKTDDIESQFLGELHFYKGSGSAGELSSIKLENRAIENYGKECRKQKEFASLSNLEAGAMNIGFKLDEIIKTLKSKPEYFRSRYLLFLESEFWTDIDWGQDYGLRKTFLQVSHGIFDSNPADIEWFLGRDTNYYPDQQAFIDEFERLFPCIHGSDAHSETELESRPDIDRYCWIKADPTFEGLKQIVYEPELRVKIQAEDPTESETYAKINSLTINFPKELSIKDESGEKTDFCINGKYYLEFSNNLTCIIGGRGSGKSTLAHLVYNSWINNDFKKLTTINSPLLNLDIRPNTLRKVAEYTKCEVPSQTEFFFQNEIEYAAKSIESMSTLISSRLDKLSSIEGKESLESLRENWAELSKSIDGLLQAYDQITEIDQKIFKSQESINTLKKQTEIIKSEEYKKFQTKIGELSAKITDFKSYKTDYTKVINEIDTLHNTITQMEWNADQGKTVLNSLRQMLEEHKNQLQATFIKFTANYNTKDYPSLLNQAQQDLSKYLKVRGLSPENVRELAEANTIIKKLEEQIRLSRLAKKPYQEIYDTKSQIVKNYTRAYDAYKTRFLEVSSLLQKELAGLSISAKEVRFELTVDHSRLKNSLIKFVKDSLEEDATLRADAIERLFFDGVDIETYIQNKQSIRDRVNEYTKTEKHRQVIQELVNDDIFLEKFHLIMLKYFYDIFNIQVQTKLGGKLLKNTSFGERCGIVIAIVLVAGTNPIIVDQPEDHLDGKFISDVLVPLLRNQKNNRQIILITRDANVVVGGDAELIHILESTDQRTEILPSSIENIDQREKYIWILDGGADAFTRREQKYNIGLLKSQKQDTS